jgi:hypothetical protein
MEHALIHINAVANGVITYLVHDFYNISFKIKHKIYIEPQGPPPPKKQIVGAHLLLTAAVLPWPN